MTKQEQHEFDELKKTVRDLQDKNQNLERFTDKSVKELNEGIQKKHNPVYLEKDILITAQQSIAEAMKTVLTGYQSPLNKLIISVVDENTTSLRQIISDSFTKVINTDDFKQSVINAFSHKVSRSMLSSSDSLFDKVVNELKQDASFKAKMTLAVSSVVEECLNERKS